MAYKVHLTCKLRVNGSCFLSDGTTFTSASCTQTD